MNSSESEVGHEELARRVEELEEENARLRGLLGFEHRQGGGHATAWAPTLLAVSSEPVSIDATATDAEKLGHANPGFTMATYQHVLPGMGADAANRFSQLIGTHGR